MPMNPLIAAARWAQSLLDRTRSIDFLALLALRLYLAPIFWVAGVMKYHNFDDTVDWFGTSLNLPVPWLMAFLATSAEVVGAISLVFGFALRWMCIPMMFTMFVAIAEVHWENGWLSVAEGMGIFANERTMEAAKRLAEAKEILMQHGDYDYLTQFGSLVILNNGVEFAVTYLAMLAVLFFWGAGRYLSVDYWIRRRFMPTT
jgi:uncharacterized membrane protein YphA (DoxX/SURF4 family)